MRFLRFLVGLLGLFLANLVPLFGILFLGWQTADLLFCFWIESFVVGVFTMLKIRKAGGGFFMFFFPMHYGIFMFVHLVFLIVGAFIGFFGVPQVANFPALLMGMGAFFLGSFGSHGLSYLLNFVHGREGEKRGPMYYAMLPYARIFPMHFAVILGALTALGPFILYGLKLVIDVVGYCIEHGTLWNKQPLASSASVVPAQTLESAS